ncbi:MAG: 50S ribosomal protein L24e [archaeon]
MVKCTFCKNDYDENHKGTTVVDVYGKVAHFCSSKCRKNSELGRDGRKTNWVRKTKKEKEKK